MSRKPFDRELINVRERPISSDHNEQRSDVDYTLLELIYRLTRYRPWTPGALVAQPDAGTPQPTGFIGDGFKVRPGGGLAVSVSAGLGFWNDPTVALDIGTPTIIGVNDLAAIKPLPLTQAQVIAVPANVAGNPRIDIVEVKLDRRTMDSAARDVLNLVTGAFDPTAVNKTLSYCLDGETSINGAAGINYKTGVAAGVPVAPATSAGYVKIAEVLVPNGAVAANENQIKDLRHMIYTEGGLAIDLTVDVVVGVNTTTKIIRANTPPGVVVWGGDAGSTNATINVVAGDMSDFVDAAHGLATCLMIGVYDNGAGNMILIFDGGATLLTADAGAQTAAAAAVPPVALAVGQKYVIFTPVIKAISNAGAPIAVPNGTYRFPAMIKLGR